jgi:hypothetical protein
MSERGLVINRPAPICGPCGFNLQRQSKIAHSKVGVDVLYAALVFLGEPLIPPAFHVVNSG